jgi:hypothetical protein
MVIMNAGNGVDTLRLTVKKVTAREVPIRRNKTIKVFTYHIHCSICHNIGKFTGPLARIRAENEARDHIKYGHDNWTPSEIKVV